MKFIIKLSRSIANEKLVILTLAALSDADMEVITEYLKKINKRGFTMLKEILEDIKEQNNFQKVFDLAYDILFKKRLSSFEQNKLCKILLNQNYHDMLRRIYKEKEKDLIIKYFGYDFFRLSVFNDLIQKNPKISRKIAILLTLTYRCSGDINQTILSVRNKSVVHTFGCGLGEIDGEYGKLARELGLKIEAPESPAIDDKIIISEK